ncbi:hypothetical protein [Metallosphaera hakonensis]|uniref:Lipoate--protein ligase n=1 Tax=Metallosphaera hakonensis JCM 8857 = DSM 7519 TaxID=1293036 RepID=A0A2U9IVT5_9CREN|nr:hypothetical protein [Metallosphaera hakonensis]AWS00157.1 hypothetical protein DFR87_11185 [Metallosphaera hakonensis JCM 8857 = DSM 7519]
MILRVFMDQGLKVEVTGDFFGSEDDLEILENDLSNVRPSNVKMLGVDGDELLERVKECLETEKASQP